MRETTDGLVRPRLAVRVSRPEFRSPKSEIRRKSAARIQIGFDSWRGTLFPQPAGARFGLRISAFFRVSGIRISEFTPNRVLAFTNLHLSLPSVRPRLAAW